MLRVCLYDLACGAHQCSKLSGCWRPAYLNVRLHEQRQSVSACSHAVDDSSASPDKLLYMQVSLRARPWLSSCYPRHSVLCIPVVSWHKMALLFAHFCFHPKGSCTAPVETSGTYVYCCIFAQLFVPGYLTFELLRVSLAAIYRDNCFVFRGCGSCYSSNSPSDQFHRRKQQATSCCSASTVCTHN